MGLWATTTSFPHLMPYFLKGNATSDTFGVSLLSTHIDRAEAQIASALSRRYSMPFSQIPPDVRRITEDLTSYFVIRASNYQDGKQKNQYLENFGRVLEDIEAIAKGERGLLYTDGSLVPVKSASRFGSSTKDMTPVFGIDDPQNWAPDPDLVDNLEDARDE